MSLPVLAPSMIAEVTVAGLADAAPCRYSAAAPATCGDAIEVPLIVFVAVSEEYQAEVMPDPGAKRSTQLPMFENDERASLEVLAPTVRAAGTRPGDSAHASALLVTGGDGVGDAVGDRVLDGLVKCR